MELCRRSRYVLKPSSVLGAPGGATGTPGEGGAQVNTVWDWVEEFYWEPCGGLEGGPNGSILGNFEQARNGFGVKPGSNLPVLPYFPRVQDWPCHTCDYIRYQDLKNGKPDPRGGSIRIRNQFGARTFDRYVKGHNGAYVENPELRQSGYSIVNGECKCNYVLSIDDYDEPSDLSNDPDGYDCNEQVKEFLSGYPAINGCDEATKKLITKAYFDACKKLKKNANNSLLENIWTGNNKSMIALASCMLDFDLFSQTRSIHCTQLPGGQLAFTDGTINDTKIDFQKMNAFADKNNESRSEMLSYTLLHELTHICCAQATTAEEQGADGRVIKKKIGCEEGDLVLLGFLLYGDTTPSSILAAQIQALCDNERMKKRKADVNSIFNLAGHQLGQKWIISGQTMIDLSTGEMYLIPEDFATGQWDRVNDKPKFSPIGKVPVPPGGYTPCSV